MKLSVGSSGAGSGSSRFCDGDELGSDGGNCEVSCVERLCSGDWAENSGGDESGGVNIDGIEAVEGAGVGDGSA